MNLYSLRTLRLQPKVYRLCCVVFLVVFFFWQLGSIYDFCLLLFLVSSSINIIALFRNAFRLRMEIAENMPISTKMKHRIFCLPWIRFHFRTFRRNQCIFTLKWCASDMLFHLFIRTDIRWKQPTDEHKSEKCLFVLYVYLLFQLELIKRVLCNSFN